MIERNVTIINTLGLHARAAAKLVNLANRFKSAFHIIKDVQKVNGKSILGILLLASGKGTKLVFTFEGEDEEQAAEAVCKLVEEKFDEN
ncbi:HPr family phosphocarrier protein [Acidobacteriota bacterium]